MKMLKIPEQTDMTNMFYNVSKGHISKIGYKSFRGLIQMLKRANASCLYYNYSTEIRFKLPIKWK